MPGFLRSNTFLVVKSETWQLALFPFPDTELSRGVMSCHPRHVSPANPPRSMSDYTIYLTDEETDWIAELQEQTGASSRSKVLRNALANYHAEQIGEAATNDA